MKTILAYFMVLQAVAACAQTGSIQRGFAYFKKMNPGTVMVDETGNTVTPAVRIVHFMYVETKTAAAPLIDRVLIKNTAYDAAVYPVTGPAVPGKKLIGELITIEPKRGNSLWKIELTPAQKKGITAKAPSVNEIIIYERKGKKMYTFSIRRLTELQSEPSY